MCFPLQSYWHRYSCWQSHKNPIDQAEWWDGSGGVVMPLYLWFRLETTYHVYEVVKDYTIQPMWLAT